VFIFDVINGWTSFHNPTNHVQSIRFVPMNGVMEELAITGVGPSREKIVYNFKGRLMR
jgi:hypothetical protein